MEDLLTAQQVQNLLQVNRITIYRMLQDGRLRGVKIGQQWRFPAGQFENLLSGKSSEGNLAQNSSCASLPVHCIQAIQDLYAELGMIGAIIVDPDGNQITEVSNPCEMCVLINSTEAGQQACDRSWCACVSSGNKSQWYTCHAGLNYMKIPIYDHEKIVAYLLTGQLYFEQGNRFSDSENLGKLAMQCEIDESALKEATKCVPVYDADRKSRMENWPPKFTLAVEAMLKERSDLVDRLQKIVKISTL